MIELNSFAYRDEALSLHLCAQADRRLIPVHAAGKIRLWGRALIKADQGSSPRLPKPRGLVHKGEFAGGGGTKTVLASKCQFVQQEETEGTEEKIFAGELIHPT